MTTYASEVRLDPYQAEVFLSTLKAYGAETGHNHLDAITRDVEDQMPGPMRVSGWPMHFSQLCEWAFKRAGRSPEVGDILAEGYAFEDALLEGRQPTELQVLAYIWRASFDTMRMTSTSSFCWPKDGG